MNEEMLYQYMGELLDIKFNVESIKLITELSMEGMKTRADVNGERLLMCYCVYLESIEKALKGCISELDHAIIDGKKRRRKRRIKAK